MSRSVVAGRHCDDTRGPQRRSLRRRKRYGGSRKARRSLPKFGITKIAEEVELFVKAEDWAGSLLCLYFKYRRGRKSAVVAGPLMVLAMEPPGRLAICYSPSVFEGAAGRSGATR